MQSILINTDKVQKVLLSIAAVEAIIILIIGVIVKTADIKIDTADVVSYGDGWVNAATLEEIDKEIIKVMPGESIELKKYLPDQLTDDYMLFFYDFGFRVAVFMNGQEIYDSGIIKNRDIGEETGAIWRTIPLKQKWEKQEILITLYNDTDSKLQINMDRIFVGTQAYLSTILYKTSLMSILIAFICILTCLLLGVGAYTLKKNGYGQYAKRMGTLSLLTFLTATWITAQSNILQFVVSNASIRYMTIHLSLMLVPLVLNRYFRLTVTSNREIFMIFSNTYEVAMVICLFLYMINVVHISQTVFIVHVYLIMEILLIGHTGAGEYIRKRDIQSLGMLIAFPEVGVFIIIAIYMYYYTTYVNMIYNFIGIGYIIFLGIILFTQIRTMMAQYRLQQDKKEYEMVLKILGDKNDKITKKEDQA